MILPNNPTCENDRAVPVLPQKPQKPKRIRLDKKQRWFLGNVFDGGQAVEEALRDLHIRHQTLRRWFTKPVFLNALENRISNYHLHSRIEVARFVPIAVNGLGFICKETVKVESVRKACNDVLKLQHDYQTLTAGRVSEKPDGKKEKDGGILDILGGVVDKHGGISDKLSGTQTPSNPRFSPENEHSDPFPTQNHPESGPEDSPIVDSGPPEPVSPYKNNNPDNPAYAHCDWYHKMFEDWNTDHPDDPDVIDWLKRKKNSIIK
jgi:hypothetical protein